MKISDFNRLRENLDIKALCNEINDLFEVCAGEHQRNNQIILNSLISYKEDLEDYLSMKRGVYHGR